MLVDLKKTPYNLDDSQIKWVEDTISNLSLLDKVKQLFVCLTSSKEETYLKDIALNLKPAGIRYNPAHQEEVLKQNLILQSNSSIPFFIAANTESGGNGAFIGGTEVGCETKVAATNDVKYAYELGKISALEAKSVGINTLFAPIVDIHNNFHNPVISNRTFGNDPTNVLNMSLAFFKAAKEEGLLCAAKHFPGDGYDERDQHLASSTNPLSTKSWDESFGKIYRALILEGLPMIMAGHIKLPSYQKYFNPSLKDSEILPATVSKELITDLLKTKLGFNGLVITDATHMVGLTSTMKRKDFIPQIINAGCDLILFYNDIEEDISYLFDAINEGKVSLERVDDCLRRSLGLKAKLYFKNGKINLNIEDLKGFSELELQKDQQISNEVARKSITLVKNLDNVLPITTKKNKRILLVIQEDENPFKMFMPKNMKTIYDYIKDKLETLGFEVTIFESLMDRVKKLPPQEAMKLVNNVYGAKTPITDLTNNYDLIIQFANFMSHNTVQRISWKLSKGTADIPWYVYEVPTIFVSLNSPFHLFDVPQVKTYINCYDKNKNTIDALIDKLTGKEKFTGVSPVDAFCGVIDTKY